MVIGICYCKWWCFVVGGFEFRDEELKGWVLIKVDSGRSIDDFIESWVIVCCYVIWGILVGVCEV